MRYRSIYANRDHYYSVGVDDETGEWLMEVVITWVACYSIYFRLTPAEIGRFNQDHDALTDLSYELASDIGRSKFRDRLVLNERPEDYR